MTDRISQEQKDRAGDKFQHAKTFLSEEYFPEERREQFIYRGKKVLIFSSIFSDVLLKQKFQVIIECQKHDDYQSSLRWLLDTLKNYRLEGQKTAQGTVTHGQTVLTSVRYMIVY
jgi:hypothetical protein